MGVGSAPHGQHGDAGRLIGVRAGREPRIDVGDAQRRTGPRRVKIGIENTSPRAELKFQAIALAYLEGRIAEARDQLLRRKAEELSRLVGRWRLRDLGHWLLRAGGAGSEE